MEIVLRPYQSGGISDLSGMMRSKVNPNGHKRVIFVAPTGAGKGRTMAELCRRAYRQGTKTLLIADRRKLIHQLAKNLEDIGVPYGVIMAGETRRTKETIILSSRDTLDGWIKSEELSPPEADLVLVEECHLSLGDRFKYLIDHYGKAYIIGFTATPIRGDGRTLKELYQALYVSVLPSQLIQEKFLIKPDVYHPEELAQKRAAGEKVKGLAGDPIQQWRKHADGLPTIAICKSVAESLELMERFKKAGIDSEHIDAKCSDEERERKFERLQNGTTKVLCSVKLLITGVDIPEVACLIVWCKMGSLIEWLQSGGRIMRPVFDKITGESLKQRAVILDHSGAAFSHGVCPGDDIEWELADYSTIQAKIKDEIKEGKRDKLITCPKCSLTFASKPICPSCGYALGKQERRQRAGADSEGYDAEDENLVKYESSQRKTIEREHTQREWFKAINLAISRGKTASYALKVFESATGQLPWKAGVYPLPEKHQWETPAKDAFVSMANRRKKT